MATVFRPPLITNPRPATRVPAVEAQQPNNLLDTTLKGRDAGLMGGGMMQRYDYPNPVWKTYPQDLRTTTNSKNLLADAGLMGGGLMQRYDYPNPVPKTYPVDLRFFAQTNVENTLANISVPFHQVVDLPVYGTAYYPNALRTTIDYYVIDQTVPFVQGATFDTPARKSYPLDLRTTLVTPLLLINAQVPFVQSVYDLVPPSKTYPLDLRSTIQPSRAILVPIQPFNQNDWPLPSTKGYSNDFRTTLSYGPITIQPFSQQDWPNPRWRVYATDLRTSLQKGLTLPTTTIVPAHQTDWPNPAWKFYALDLRTSFSPGITQVPIFLVASPCDIFVVVADSDFATDVEPDFLVIRCDD